jgi:hypothetical protein
MSNSKIFNRSMLLISTLICVAACSRGVDFDIRPSEGGGHTPTRSYAVSVGGQSAGTSTRAEYDGVTYRWSVGDRMGFYVVPAGGNTPVISNERFTSTNTEAAVATDFEGEISEPMLSRINPAEKYDYYSYYPYRANTGGVGAMKVAFTIPETISLTPDVISTDYGFMVAKATMGASDEPFSWLDATTREQMHGSRVSFRYKHVMAYLGVYLKINLMSKPIGKIVISATDGTPVWGTSAVVDLLSEAVTFTGGSGRLTVNISGGVGVSTVAGKGYVWIPVSPVLAGKQLRFEFYTTEGFRIGEDDDFVLTAGTLSGGKRHRAGFQLPFFVDFSQGVSSVSGGYSSFGHTITTKNDVSSDDDGLRLEGAGLGGSTWQEDRGAIKLPLLDLTTNPAYTRRTGYVRIKIDAHGPNSLSSDSYRRLYYGGMSASDYNVPTSAAYFQLKNYNTGAEYEIYNDSGSSVQLSGDTYVTFRTNAGASYRSWIRKIWVYPNFD